MRKKILIIVVLLLLLAVGIAVYFYFSNLHRVSVINQSKSFSLTYSQTKQFDTVLDEMGVWKKDGITVRSDEPPTTIKEVKIVLQDDEASASLPGINPFISTKRIENNTYTITVLANKDVASSRSSEFISNMFLSDVILQLYIATHPRSDLQNSTSGAGTIISTLQESRWNPFVVQLK